MPQRSHPMRLATYAALLLIGACRAAPQTVPEIPRKPAIERPPREEPDRPVYQAGVASYYHDSLAGNLTANGERYDPRAATCAHRKLPFGTKVEVRVVKSGKKVTCRINDRGPYVSGRIIDLSRALAEELEMTKQGVAKVEVRILDAD